MSARDKNPGAKANSFARRVERFRFYRDLPSEFTAEDIARASGLSLKAARQRIYHGREYGEIETFDRDYRRAVYRLSWVVRQVLEASR